MGRRSTIADTGFLNPGTTADDSTVGTVTWTNTSNVTSSNDTYASASISATADYAVDDNSVRLYSGGAFVGDEKASATNWNLTTDATRTYGGAAVLWGLTPSESDVENSGWGVGISCQRDASTPESHYLLATNFGVSISASSIDGIEVAVECHYENGLGGASFVVGTLVLTPTGPVRNDLLKIGDIVIAFDKHGDLRNQRVVGIKRAVRRVFRVVANGKEALVTATEKFLVGGNVFKKLSELGVGDTIYRAVDGLLVPVVIECIERVGSDEVISLEIEKDHTYIAAGFAVHNVMISGSTTAYIDHIKMKIYYTASTTQVFMVT